MPNKFQCRYNLILKYRNVQTNELEEHLVEDPITIQFNISKGIQGNNQATITVYNMDPGIRNSIFTDRILFNDENEKYVLLSAGYGGSLTTCLYGQIYECSSTLQGTDVVTTMTVIDADINNQCSITIEAGTSYKEAYKLLVSEMKNLKLGEIGELEGTFGVPTTFDGNTLYAINKITGKHTFIDNGILHTLNDNETLSDYGAYLVSADTGLLGTPIRRDATLEIRTIFEPTLRVGQLVEVQSTSGSQFNGQYKVFGLDHNCVISGNEGGQRTTTIYLMYLDQLTNSNVALTGNTVGKNPTKIENGKEIPITTGAPSDVVQVYNYIQKNNGAVPNTMCNRKISWASLIGNNNTDAERKRELTIPKLTNCKATADALANFVQTSYGNVEIKVNSCWRSTSNNKREGGKADSRHLTGQAIDFKIKGMSIARVWNSVRSRWSRGYVGLYNTFIHAQIAGNKNKFYRG